MMYRRLRLPTAPCLVRPLLLLPLPPPTPTLRLRPPEPTLPLLPLQKLNFLDSSCSPTLFYKPRQHRRQHLLQLRAKVVAMAQRHRTMHCLMC